MKNHLIPSLSTYLPSLPHPTAVYAAYAAYADK